MSKFFLCLRVVMVCNKGICHGMSIQAHTVFHDALIYHNSKLIVDAQSAAMFSKKIGRQRTPLLYDSTESQLRRAAKRSLLPSTDDVKQIITSRINSIEDEGTIPADPTILLAAKVLKLKRTLVVELDKECLVNASDGYSTLR